MLAELRDIHAEQMPEAASGSVLFGKALDYFEECMRRMALVAVTVYGENDFPDAKINEALARLSMPSLGDWNNFINIVLKWHRRMGPERSVNHGDILEELDRVIAGKLEHPDFLRSYQRLILELEGRELNPQAVPFRALIDLIIRLRNKLAHGGKPSEELQKELALVVRNVLDIWIGEADFLEGMELRADTEAKPIYRASAKSKKTQSPADIPTGSGSVKSRSGDSLGSGGRKAGPSLSPQRVNLVNALSGETILRFDFLILALEDGYYYINGNARMRKAEYTDPVHGGSLSDTDKILKEQIAYFARLRGIDLSEKDLGGKVATSLAELSGILARFESDASGRVIADEFRILDEIGRGGMGIVYRALQLSRNRICAVKILPRNIVSDETIFYRFKREAATLEAFEHENIVEFIDFGETESEVYLAMEFIDGESLDKLFRDLRADINRRPTEEDLRRLLTGDNPAPLTFERDHRNRLYAYKIVEWLGSISDAMDYIHKRHVLHRDIKHANIMIDRSSGRPVLLDFGLAKNQEMTLTMEGQFLGTMRFASPEQLMSTRHVVDERSDVYSLGVVLYELLSLRPIFLGNNVEKLSAQIASDDPPAVREIAPDIDRDLETIAHKCVEKSPERRYANAAGLRDDLRHFMNHEPIKARPPGMFQRLMKWTRRNPGRASGLGVGLAAALILAVVGSMLIMRILDESERARKAEISALEQRDAAIFARAEAERQRGLALTQKQRADMERDRAVFQRTQTELQTRRAQSAEIKVLAESSQKFYSAGREFEALLPAIQAGRRAKERGEQLSRDDYYYVAGALFQAVRNRHELMRLEGHGGPVTCLAGDPRGGFIASGGTDGTLRLWSVKDGQLLKTWKHAGLRDLDVSPDGRFIAFATGDGKIHLRHAKDGSSRVLARGDASALRFSRDGRLLAAGRSSGRIGIYRVSDGRLLHSLRAHTGGILDLDFHPRSGLLVSGSRDRSLRVWSVKTGRGAGGPFFYSAPVTAVRFHPRLARIASGGADGEMRIQSLRPSAARALSRGHNGAVTSLRFNNRGTILASAGMDGMVRLRRSRDGRLLKSIRAHASGVRRMDFNPDGRRLITAGNDRVIRVWRPWSRGADSTLRDARGLFAVAFSPDGRFVAGAGRNRAVILWNARTGRRIRSLRGHRGDINALAFSPDGGMLASGASDRTVRLWRTSDGARIRAFRGHTDWVSSVAFTPDGRRLVSGGGDRRVRLWNVGDGKQVASLNAHRDEVLSVAVSPDGSRIASAGRDGEIRIRALPGGDSLLAWKGHGHWVESLSFSPGGGLLASAGRDRVIHVWNTSTGEKLKTLKGHGNWVSGVRFSPNGRLLVSGGRDRTLRLWLLSAGKEIAALRGHTGRIESVSFSPDGLRLASGGGDGTLRLWNLDIDRLMRAGCRHVRWYLRASPGVRVEDRNLCEGVE